MQKTKTQPPLSKVALLLAFGLAGCNQNNLDSQVEKCVQAAIKAYGGADKTEADRSSTEVQARVICLKAASGQKN